MFGTMSYSDRFYPGNQSRRCQAENLHLQLRKSTLSNAYDTHVFMEYMKVYMQRQLTFSESLKDRELTQACVTLLGHMAEIRKNVPLVDGALKQRLPPESYQKLQGIDEPKTEFAGKLRSVSAIILWCLVLFSMAVSVPAVSHYISTVVNNFPLKLINQVNASLVVVLGTVCLGFGADVLLSMALGAWEEQQLTEKIKQYERALEEIERQSCLKCCLSLTKE